MSHRQTPPDWDAYPIEDGSQGQLFLPLCTTPERLQRILQALHEFYPDNIHDQEHLIDIITAMKYQDDPLGAPCVQSIFLGEFMANLDTELAADGLSFRLINGLTGQPIGDWIPLPIIQHKFVSGPSLPPGSDPKVIDLGVIDGVRNWEIQPVTGDTGEDSAGIKSVDLTELEPGETAYAQLIGDALKLFIPRGADGADGADGAGIDDVLVWSLEPGETPTVDLTNGLLQLGIPRGADGVDGDGIKDVILKMLDPDSTPYAYLVEEVLELGIPSARDGQDGIGYSPITIPIEDTKDDTLAHICAGVGFALDRAMALYLDHLDELELFVQGLSTESQVIVAALETLSLPFSPVVNFEDIPLNEVVEYVFNSNFYQLDRLRELVTDPVAVESWKTDLYCRILNNNNQLTEAIYNDWLDNLVTPEIEQMASFSAIFDFNSFTVPGGLPVSVNQWVMGGSVGGYLNHLLGYSGFLSYYSIGYPNFDRTCSGLINCAPKYDWCVEWDANRIYAGLPNFDPLEHATMWTIEQGVEDPNGVVTQYLDPLNKVSLTLDFHRAAVVKKIKITVSGAVGAINASQYDGQFNTSGYTEGIRLYDAGSTVATAIQAPGGVTTQFERFFNHTATRVTIDFYAGINDGLGQTPPGGQLTIEKIEICGTGDHPMAWCHRINYEEAAYDAYPIAAPLGGETAAYLPHVGWIAQADAIIPDPDNAPTTLADGIQLIQPLPLFDLVSVRLQAEFDNGDTPSNGNNVVALQLEDGTRLEDSTPAADTPAGGFTSHVTFNPAETTPAIVTASLISRGIPDPLDARRVTIRSITVCGLGYNPFTAPPPEEDEWPEVLFNYDHCVEVDFRIDQSEYWTIENSNGVFVPDVGIVATYTGVNNYRAYLYSSQVTSSTSVVGAALQATPLGPGFAEQTALHFKNFLRTGNFPTEEYTLYEFNPPGTTIAPEEIRIQMEHRSTSWGNPPGPASQFTLIRARFYFLGDNPFPNLPSC